MTAERDTHRLTPARNDLLSSGSRVRILPGALVRHQVNTWAAGLADSLMMPSPAVVPDRPRFGPLIAAAACPVTYKDKWTRFPPAHLVARLLP